MRSGEEVTLEKIKDKLIPIYRRVNELTILDIGSITTAQFLYDTGIEFNATSEQFTKDTSIYDKYLEELNTLNILE